MARRDGAGADGVPPAATQSARRWSHLTAAEVHRRAQRGAVGLWPIGATEQHGPHLVTGFDHLVAEIIAAGAAEELGDRAILVPTLPVGASGHWLALGGTLSVTPQTLSSVLVEVCSAAGQAGLRHVVVVNGHAGNVGPGLSALGVLRDGRPTVEFVSYWDLVEPAELAGLRRADSGIGHAGEYETSVALHLDGLVRRDLVPRSGRPLEDGSPGSDRAPFQRVPSVSTDIDGGVLGDPGAASRALGEAIVSRATAALVDHCLSVHADLEQGPTSADGRADHRGGNERVQR